MRHQTIQAANGVMDVSVGGKETEVFRMEREGKRRKDDTL